MKNKSLIFTAPLGVAFMGMLAGCSSYRHADSSQHKYTYTRNQEVVQHSPGDCQSAFVHAMQSVTLAWDPITDRTVASYIIYYGAASGDYTNSVNVGNATNATIPGLIEGETYYFAVAARNLSGEQSKYSNEINYTVPFGLHPRAAISQDN